MLFVYGSSVRFSLNVWWWSSSVWRNNDLRNLLWLFNLWMADSSWGLFLLQEPFLEAVELNQVQVFSKRTLEKSFCRWERRRPSCCRGQRLREQTVCLHVILSSDWSRLSALDFHLKGVGVNPQFGLWLWRVKSAASKREASDLHPFMTRVDSYTEHFLLIQTHKPQ